MCGIAGWLAYERDVRAHRDILERMTETMARRGPDAKGIWADVHVGLGHRRLAVIDIEGGRQPMLAERDGHLAAVLTYSGEVYNFEDLRRELTGRGHVFRTRSDTEVVLSAYLEWGENVADHLNGMFAFAVWDARQEMLLLVRDQFGIKPLFYLEAPDGVLFGSEAKAIFAHPEAHRRIDADGLRELTLLVKRPEHGIFAGLREVRPGQVVRIDRRGVSKRAYWQLQARPHTDDLATTVQTVRDLLTDIVARQTVADVPLCCLLSGGLDSSIITALADRQLRRRGQPRVRSFSVDFVGADELPFEKDAIGRHARDTPFVHDFVDHVGTRHDEIILENEGLLDSLLLADVTRARDFPHIRTFDMYTSLWLLFKAVRRTSTVALSGEAADEVFGGYVWMFDRQSIDGATFPWLAAGSRAFCDMSTILSKSLRDALDFRAFERDVYADALAEVPRLEGDGDVEARMREMSYQPDALPALPARS